MLARDVTRKQADEVQGKVARLLELCKAKRISELVPSAVQTAIGSLRTVEKLSLQTCNHYLKAAKQFGRWLYRDGRARENTLAHLSGYNVRTDRRHDRRALTDKELGRLIKAAENGPVVMGMAGPDRAMLYRLALNTGFRANEIRSLTPEALNPNAIPPTVTVEAGYSKRRRRDEQEINVDFARDFQTYLAGRQAGAPVFKMPDKPGKMLKVDLKAAEIPEKDAGGRFVDFHALRHTYITNVVKSGASVKVCQELARHSDPKLTLGVYTHLSVHDRAAGVRALPDGTTRRPDKEAARATGTFDAVPRDAGLTAHVTARRGHERPSNAITGQGGKVDVKGGTRIQSPVRVSTCHDSAQADTTPCARSSMDRAPVFGTEG